MLSVRSLWLALLLIGAGSALAHAEFERGAPGRAEIVAASPEVVALHFSEPVEVRFSVFKVYPLHAEVDTVANATVAAATPSTVLTEREALRLNGLAGALVNDVIELRDDEEDRADANLLTSEARSSAITLALKPDLVAGTYVVMWRVLSIDTHVSQGFYLFVIAGP